MSAIIFGPVVAALLTCSGSPANATSEDVSSAEALKRLSDGNQRFASGSPSNPRCDAARRNETAEKGQHPIATVLTCSDSRVSPEFAFDQGVGDLFTVRVAGNVADTDEIATIEYGVGHLHTPLLVVMGHSSCGAVAAAVSGAELDGSLPRLVERIDPAVRETRKAHPAAQNNLLVARAIEANIFHSIEDILERSSEIRELAKEGKLRIVGAVYDIAGGGVRWLGAHPQQSSIIFSNKRSEPVGDHAAPHRKPSSSSKTVVAGTQAEKHAPVQAAAAVENSPACEQALAALREGNERFAAGTTQNPRRDRDRRQETARGQHPIATVLACSDSRVPVERLFDQGVGDVFTIRYAGNVADTNQIASIEYATGHLETPLLVVLGHSACGAVTAVANGAELHGSLPQLVDNIRPAVARVRKASPGLTGSPLVAAAIRANVQQAISDVLARSPGVRKRVESGKLKIVGGVYDLAAGKVEWLSDAPAPEPEASESPEKPHEESKPAPEADPHAPPTTPAPAHDPHEPQSPSTDEPK